MRAFGLLLFFISSVVNPFIYAFNSSNYRRAFKTLLKCKQTPWITFDPLVQGHFFGRLVSFDEFTFLSSFIAVRVVRSTMGGWV